MDAIQRFLRSRTTLTHLHTYTHTMATKATAAPEVSNNLIHLFESDEFMGEVRALPHAQMLNHDTNFGLFVKQDSLKRVGWTGPEPTFTHRFRTGDSEKGFHTTTPHLKVLRRSPRFVEDRKTKAILANFETADGQRLRDERPKDTTLRTLWLVYLCDETGKRYHNQPLILSMHGAAGARFGTMYERWQQSIDDAYAKMSGKNMVAARNQKVYSLFTFSPTLDMEMVGDGQESSPVCVVVDFEEADADNLLSLCAQGEEMQLIWQAAEAYRSFDARFLRSCEKAFGFSVAPNLINPETGEIDFGALPAEVVAATNGSTLASIGARQL